MKGITDTSFEELDGVTFDDGHEVKRFVVGPEDDPASPWVFYGKFPPNKRVDPHTHAADYCEIVLQGSQMIGRKWYNEGDIRIVRGGTPYGPLVAGPDGCTVLVIFSDSRWEPIPLRTDLQDGLGMDVLPAAFAPTASATSDQ